MAAVAPGRVISARPCQRQPCGLAAKHQQQQHLCPTCVLAKALHFQAVQSASAQHRYHQMQGKTAPLHACVQHAQWQQHHLWQAAAKRKSVPQGLTAHALSYYEGEQSEVRELGVAPGSPRQQQQELQDNAETQPEQQEQVAACIPPEEVWTQELRHLMGLMADPNKPLLRQFVLHQCYLLNSNDTRDQFRQLSAAALAKIASDRQRVEGSVARGANGVCAAWCRLELLAEAVVDQGAALTEEQLAKEREGLVGLGDRLRHAQRVYSRTLSRATELSDTTYLGRSGQLQALLRDLGAAAEAYLAVGVANIAAASRVNSSFRRAWANTPPAQRPPPAVAEAQRQAQLAPLLPLLPEGPAELLGRYRAAARAFQLHRDPALQQRRPATGLPSSSGSRLWQQGSTDLSSVTPPWSPTQHTAAAEGGNSTEADQAIQEAPPPPITPRPLQPSGAAWQQPLHQLMARPVPPLPLLPHLAKRWVRQQTLAFRQQQRLELRNQQIQRINNMGWSSVTGPGADPSTAATQDLVNLSLLKGGSKQQQTGAGAVEATPSSLSGKVLPPLSVLYQRALEVERQLLQQAEHT